MLDQVGHQTANNPDIAIGRHAVAIDERRAFLRMSSLNVARAFLLGVTLLFGGYARAWAHQKERVQVRHRDGKLKRAALIAQTAAYRISDCRIE
jgi:hypothetical protein